MDASSIKRITIRTALTLTFDYADTSPVMHAVNRYDVQIVNTEYSEQTMLTVAIRRSLVADLIAGLVESTAGRVAIHHLEEAAIGERATDDKNDADG